MKTYMVKELFGPTIQGEGHGQGEVVLFLRFAGCNKWTGRLEDKASSACPFCDTDFVGGKKMNANEIMLELLNLQGNTKIKTVVVSGGEPLLQLDEELAKRLASTWFVYVETNGSKDISPNVMKHIHHVCCSPKQSPSETKIHRIDSLKVLHPAENIRRHIINFMGAEFQERFPNLKMYIQPVMDQNYAENVQKSLAICYLNPEVKLSIQLHKVIEVQ
jgi:7-carboxy-7-deazaguanine synthase